ncbi:MAG: beta-lactamase family protein [Firmicutes bacterium]|nr:beta-lactamase family protein [Bacillota bacterium]
MNTLTQELSGILAASLPEKYTSVSYAIVKDGQLLAADALGTTGGRHPKKATADCTYNVASVSKIYCTVAVMQLVEQGKVDLDTPIYKYLPRFMMPDERYKKITLRHCLSHSSGLPGTQWKGFSVSDTTDEDAYYDWVYSFMAHSYLKAEPGEYSVYCNDGFTMAEMVVAQVSGEAYGDYCMNHITEPIGAHSSRLAYNQNPAHPLVIEGKGPQEKLLIQGGAGYTTSMTDLCTFGMQFLGKSAIISEESKREMAKKQGCTFLSMDERSESFGLGWDTVCMTRPDFDLGEGVLVKGGNSFQFTTQFIVVPKYNAVLAMSETHDCKLDVQEVLLRLFAYVMSREGVNICKKGKLIPEAYIEKYAGTYLIPSGILEMKMYGAHCSVVMKNTRGGQHGWLKPFTFDGEKFVSEDRTLLFEEAKGDTFALSAFNGITAPMAQKATAGQPLSSAWKKRLGKKYIVVDATATDIVINDISTGFIVKQLEGFEGVLVFSFSGSAGTEIYGLFESAVKPVEDDIATGFLRTPSNPSRDLCTPMFEERGGVEYCVASSYVYKDVAALPVYEGQGFGKKGEENAVYRLPYKLSQLPKIPKGRRIMVMNDDLSCVWDSLKGLPFTGVDSGYISFI